MTDTTGQIYIQTYKNIQKHITLAKNEKYQPENHMDF